MLGGRLLETENKKKSCEISGLKSVFKQYLTERLFTKWSLMGGGRLRDEKIDCILQEQASYKYIYQKVI